MVVELRHGFGAEAVRRADAVACRFAAAYHDDALSAHVDRIRDAPGVDPILRNEEVEREVNAFEVPSGKR